ncbi:terminase small subunit [Clostridium botulinum]|uniref:terminase small subunit n=1 Tax=Clostridium botulinum TaxID=1491 RepID=UPI0006AC3F31|nr:terminase small subunit [Clostridium botulinum]KOR54845.1 terminase [Clostridium botulinum]MBY6839569.1 terminase small subunit [Clostridium botulinum]MCR1163713.1 terminase small subunit [Clostridium botulinum]NFM78160.1 terminase [Clostridium botulinum]NFN89977.1 terminase [Clostridium botulinum]
MENIRGPDWNLIKEEYLKLNGNVKLKEFAEKYGVKYSTLRSRKNRENWDSEINKNVATKSATQQKNVATENKNKNNNKQPIAEEVKEVLENTELTDKQRLFCIYYIKSFNATQSAIKAGYAPDSAHVEGSRLLRNVKVKAYIRELKGKMTEEIFIDAMDVLNKYIKIAFADITDYLTFGQKEVTVMGPFGPVKDEEGNELTKVVNYVDFKESNIVDGTIINEVKQGKDGVSIKFEDRMKALDKLSQYFDLFPDKFKRKIEDEKVKQAREKLELEKSKVNGDETEVEDDGFLDALNGRAAEVWKNE